MNIPVEALLQLIGTKEVELNLARQANINLVAKNKELTTELDKLKKEKEKESSEPQAKQPNEPPAKTAK